MATEENKKLVLDWIRCGMTATPDLKRGINEADFPYSFSNEKR